jgi:hypothetical protein
MRRIGISEFRDRATRFLAGREVLAIERHGKLVGYYVPVATDESGVRVAIRRLRDEVRERHAPLAALIRRRRAEILKTAERYGARNVRVFGSVLHGEDKPGSDLDLLVDFDAGRSLLDLIGLSQDLAAMLGRKVDVVTAAGLKPWVRDRILAEAQPL